MLAYIAAGIHKPCLVQEGLHLSSIEVPQLPYVSLQNQALEGCTHPVRQKHNVVNLTHDDSNFYGENQACA